MRNPTLLIASFALLTASFSYAADIQSASGSDGFGVFSSSGGSGGSSGTFTGASDIGTSWGFFASSGEISEAFYDFSGGALTVGQTLSVKMDNSSIQAGGTVGLGLQNIGTGNRFEFFFVGGDSNYTALDNAGSNDTGIGFTSSGLTLDFTLTATDTYSLDITPSGSGTTTVMGTLSGTGGTGIDRLRFFNFNAGSGPTFDAYFNDISVVPEPNTYALIASLMALSYVMTRRRAR